jgi:orotate phosphoribosyltransferase
MKEQIASYLLSIGAVELRPDTPFTWTSGIESPIYCDNRLTMAFPMIRKQIAQALADGITKHYPEVEMIAGTATAGIPHAAWVADILDLPMAYIRSSAKAHGKQSQIEGRIDAGCQVVIIEDLISTGKSVRTSIQAVREVDAEVLGVAAIFSYGFEQARQWFVDQQIPYFTLTDYHTLLQVAKNEGQLTEAQLSKIASWDPFK